MIESFLSTILASLIANKYTLGLVAVGLLATFVFWCLWVTLNIAYNRRKRLVYKVLLYVCIIPGALIDVVYNYTIGTILFLEFPTWDKERTLSMRLTTYLRTKNPGKTIIPFVSKVRLAVWIATNLIEPWSPGHIGLERFGYPAARDAMKWLMNIVP